MQRTTRGHATSTLSSSRARWRRPDHCRGTHDSLVSPTRPLSCDRRRTHLFRIRCCSLDPYTTFACTRGRGAIACGNSRLPAATRSPRTSRGTSTSHDQVSTTLKGLRICWASWRRQHRWVCLSSCDRVRTCVPSGTQVDCPPGCSGTRPSSSVPHTSATCVQSPPGSLVSCPWLHRTSTTMVGRLSRCRWRTSMATTARVTHSTWPR